MTAHSAVVLVITALLSYTDIFRLATADVLQYGQVGDVEVSTSAGVDYSGVSFLLREYFDRDAIVFAFKASYRNLNPVRFQIWRPVTSNNISNSKSYRLVSELSHIPTSLAEKLPTIETFYLVSDLESIKKGQKCLRVVEGDRLGVYFEQSQSSLGYVYSSSSADDNCLMHVFDNATYPVTDRYQAIRFQQIIFPYNFLAAAYFYYGENTTVADDDTDDTECNEAAFIPPDGTRLKPTIPPPRPGVIGNPGPFGPVGDKGVKGPIGSLGNTGDVGSVGAIGRHGNTGDIGFTGLSGERGEAGLRGNTGADGVRGATGFTGSKGNIGSVGATGEFGYSLYVNDTNSFNSSFAIAAYSTVQWKSEEFAVGALAWLAVLSILEIVTVIALIVICTVCCQLRHSLDDDEKLHSMRSQVKNEDVELDSQQQQTVDGEGTAISDSHTASWMADLPELSTLDYTPQAPVTVGREAGKLVLESNDPTEENGDGPPPEYSSSFIYP